MRTWRFAAGATVLLAALAQGQSVQTYTEAQSGAGLRPLGYPVPQPVESLTPVDGFRSYASLNARLIALDAESENLRGEVVGSTRNGRDIRAYVVSDSDGEDVEGRPEAAYFINAATHAREWATPEVSTFLIERLLDGANDQGLVRYLLDNTRLVIIPVQNVDGLLQTQRFPTQVVVGADPRVPSDWPRDGRMRRKNMPGVDEQLTTFGDHLVGVDLNRNHRPFWGTTTQGGTLTNPNELTYRGPSAQSEPEVQAILQAASLAPESRIRLGIDLHTFSRVFFSSNTSRSRLNQIQARLIGVIGQHHLNVPTAQGSANGAFYRDVPDPPNSGIGAAAEYFAYQWLVPAWTLEIEPANGGSEYGGTNESHSGFILPASQIRRVREAWAESHLVAFYFMAGPPHLQRVRIRDASGNLLLEHAWEIQPGASTRMLRTQRLAPIHAGQPLRAELVFNKPMRYRNAAGQIASLPGLDQTLQPLVSLEIDGQSTTLDTSAGQWLGESGYQRYRDDTYRFDFSLPSSGDFALRVSVGDMVGLALDADPASAVDWSAGAWSEWEGDNGVDGDFGGSDRLTALIEATEGGVLPRVTSVVERVAEGDRLRLRLSLDSPSSETVRVLGESLAVYSSRPTLDPPLPAAVEVSWAAGETGERILELPLSDDILIQGDRAEAFDLTVLNGEQAQAMASPAVTVLDNDSNARAVMRSTIAPFQDLQQLAQSTAAARVLVVDGQREYLGPSNMLTACQQFDLQAPMQVFGNRATWRPGTSACSTVNAQGTGRVEVRDLQLLGSPPSGAPVGALVASDPATDIRLDRVSIRQAAGAQISVAGPLTVRQSVLHGSGVEQVRHGNTVVESGGHLDVEAVTLFDHVALAETASSALLRSSSAGSTSRLGSVSLFDNSAILLVDGATTVRGTLQQNPTRQLVTPTANNCGNETLSLGDNIFALGCFLSPLSSDRMPFDLGYPPRTSLTADYLLPRAEAIDQGGECASVDQRGTPRPQTLVAGSEPRCDVGAIELGVNPWRGFWQPARDGHGIDMQTQGNVLFILWYTYNDQGEPTAYQAAAALTGKSWRAELLLASRNPATGAVSNRRVGEVSLEFASDVEARLGWRFDARSAGGSEAIRALDFAAAEPRVDLTGTWYPPAESGYGASIARRGETTAAALYYYDAAGNLRWALGSGDALDASRIDLFSYRGFCPDCSADAMPVSFQAAGRLDLQMITPVELKLDSDVTYPGSEGGRWLRSGAVFAPLNDPVDNREAAAALTSAR